MGLFERLGERVERIKREVDTAKEESASYRCRDCETPIYADLEACPECGSEDLERVRRAGEEVDAPEPTSDGSSTADGDAGAPERADVPTEESGSSSPEGSDAASTEPVGPVIEEAEDPSTATSDVDDDASRSAGDATSNEE